MTIGGARRDRSDAGNARCNSKALINPTSRTMVPFTDSFVFREISLAVSCEIHWFHSLTIFVFVRGLAEAIADAHIMERYAVLFHFYTFALAQGCSGPR